MNKEFVSYDLVLELNELGFDERCLASYWKDNNNKIFFETEGEYECSTTPRIHTSEIPAPFWQQAFDWFTETHKLFPEFTLWGDGLGYICIIKEIRQEEFLEVYSLEPVDMSLATYDIHKVRPLALKTLIRIVKEKA